MKYPGTSTNEQRKVIGFVHCKLQSIGPSGQILIWALDNCDVEAESMHHRGASGDFAKSDANTVPVAVRLV